MTIYLEVTWPVRNTVRLPQSQNLAKKLKKQKSDLRQDLVCFIDDRLYIRGLFGRKNRVPDVDRYKIVRCGDSIEIKSHHPSISGKKDVSTYPYVDRPVVSNSGQAPCTLVIVLESPHRDEYGDSVTKPIAPARGATGARIHRLLKTVLKSCSQLEDLLRDCAPVRVVISNPVPFQTSAYAIHGGRLPDAGKKLRNFIWPALWDLKDPNAQKDAQPCFVLQKKFCKTLRGYNPIAIVNACTSIGKTGKTGKPEVTTILRDSCIVPLYEANHPTTWTDETELTLILPLRSGTDSK